ncbi:hypothetical protein KY308_00695, partial [Candidatus Woesearchaeota archaeon]|nr:hypothetical protein [Candidatus Woesearchaeota archaeon]
MLNLEDKENPLLDKKTLDLYDILSELKGNGYQAEDIGKLYVFAIASMNISSLVSSSLMLGHRQSQKQKKKAFEGEIKKFFTMVKNDVVIGKTSKSKIFRKYFRGDIDRQLSHSHTIEGAVKRIIEKNPNAYQRIGEAVLLGAEDYLPTKPPRLGSFRVSIEYNKI